MSYLILSGSSNQSASYLTFLINKAFHPQNSHLLNSFCFPYCVSYRICSVWNDQISIFLSFFLAPSSRLYCHKDPFLPYSDVSISVVHYNLYKLLMSVVALIRAVSWLWQSGSVITICYTTQQSSTKVFILNTN